MKLRGVPADLRVGPIELRPLGNKCELLQRCHQCDFYPRVYYMCIYNHFTCVECLNIELDSKMAFLEFLPAFCNLCRATTNLYRVEIPVQLLQTLRFLCGCNYAGRLVDIKRHTNSRQYTARCSSGEETVSDDSSFQVGLCRLERSFSECLNIFEQHFNQIRKMFQEKFIDKLNGVKEPEVFTLERGLSTQLELGLLNGRLNGLRNDFQNLKQLSQHITPLVEAIFEKSFVALSSTAFIEKNSEHTLVVSGIPFRLLISWVDLRFGNLGICVSKTMIPRDAKIWPIEKSLTIRLHDRRGFVIKEINLNTRNGNEYAHEIFQYADSQEIPHIIPNFFDLIEMSTFCNCYPPFLYISIQARSL